MLNRALVIDADVEMGELLKMTLEPESYQVFSATSGSEGLKMMAQVKPDVIILDLLLPDMDGLQVCQEIRKTSNVPIMVLSAVNKPSIVAQALDEGADDYLSKPMQANLLLAHLRRLSRRAMAEQEARRMGQSYRM